MAEPYPNGKTRTRSSSASSVRPMTMPTDIGIIDLMLDIPSGDQSEWYEFMQARSSARSRRTTSSRRSTCSATCPTPRSATTRSRSVLKLDGPLRHREGDDRRRLRGRAGRQAQRRGRTTPTASSARSASTPTRGMAGVRDLVKAYETLGIKSAIAFPAGYLPAGADQRQEVLPDLRQVHRARHPDRAAPPASAAPGCRRRARTRCSSTRCAGSSPSSSS